MKPLPPFGRAARIVSNSLWIRCGDAGWRFLEANPKCGEVVFPVEHSPDQYNWPVKGIDVYVIADNPVSESVGTLTQELIASGADKVTVIHRRVCGLIDYVTHATFPAN